MAIPGILEDLLKENNVSYKVVTHAETYTAQETAAALHVSGNELAKSVMIKSRDGYVMLVLPASWRVDLAKLKDILKDKNLRLANEDEFKQIFPECEPGAEPPFGNLYGLETFIDKSFTGNKQIVFNAGNHHEAVKMDYSDYANLVKPKVAEFAVHN